MYLLTAVQIYNKIALHTETFDNYANILAECSKIKSKPFNIIFHTITFTFASAKCYHFSQIVTNFSHFDKR